MLTHMDHTQLGSTQAYRKTQAGWQGQNLRQSLDWDDIIYSIIVMIQFGSSKVK